MNKKMGIYVSLIMILGIIYTGSLLFFNPYMTKSYVYNYPEHKLTTNNTLSHTLTEEVKKEINTFLTPLIIIKPNLTDKSDLNILTNIINLINQKKEYTLNGTTQIYPISLIQKYALEYFNKTDFNPTVGNQLFYYDNNQNAFIIYYNYQVTNINISNTEFKITDNYITVNYETIDNFGNKINYQFDVTKSDDSWLILSAF